MRREREGGIEEDEKEEEQEGEEQERCEKG